jgi:hypothetical protein
MHLDFGLFNSLPVKMGIDYYRFIHLRGAVGAIFLKFSFLASLGKFVIKHAFLHINPSADGIRIWVEQQLLRIKPESLFWLVLSVNPVTV